mgnify:CR=1 FL=1
MNISDPLHYLRKERNLLLNVTDWEMMKALEQGLDLPETWKEMIE